MSWFDRYRGDTPAAEAAAHLDGHTHGSGLVAALARACGRPGLRRFVVRFEVRGSRIRLGTVEAVPLAEGGGPPPAWDPVAVEGALLGLRNRLLPAWRFGRGALGVVRDADGTLDLALRFDDDAESFGLADLRPPAGPPHPLDHPAWQRAVAEWQGRIAALRWLDATEGWRLEGGTLEVDGVPHPATPLAVWRGELEWLLPEPAGEEPPLTEDPLAVGLAEAGEVVGLAAVRLRLGAVFRGESDNGAVVFVGI